MSDYLAWCEKTRYLSLSLSGDKLKSANSVKVINLGGTSVLLKTIRPDVVYIPRLKILGEVAYSLLDYHLDPEGRVAPNACPIFPNILWREFVQGIRGEIWRGELYGETKSLSAADLAIVGKVLNSRSAQRMALLDFIFIFQDRSARNWVIDESGNFWGIDNGMLWAYKGRHVDREAVETKKIDHLNHPMEALVSCGAKFEFQIGIFSDLHTGRIINDDLLARLSQIDWRQYLSELNGLIDVLGYPFSFIDDWRFVMLEARANWLLENRRFPTAGEAFSDEWQGLIDQPQICIEEWELEWEIENSETK